jgi:hypothetical protein
VEIPHSQVYSLLPFAARPPVRVFTFHSLTDTPEMGTCWFGLLPGASVLTHQPTTRCDTASGNGCRGQRALDFGGGITRRPFTDVSRYTDSNGSLPSSHFEHIGRVRRLGSLVMREPFAQVSGRWQCNPADRVHMRCTPSPLVHRSQRTWSFEPCVFHYATERTRSNFV